MRVPRFIPIAFLSLCLPLGATDLTPEQIESIRKKFQAIKEGRNEHVTSRNSNAGQVFSNASQDPRVAMELYLKCVELVDFEKEGRPTEDFKAWKEGFERRFDLEPASGGFLDKNAFNESLRLQLQYLALTLRAAQMEEVKDVFPSLVSYVESLSRMQEVPTDAMTSPVSTSVFARAYELEQDLDANDGWENVPFNIGGIYEKTILPYLRQEDPGGLINAWDKLIEQQKRLVLTIESAREEELRGLNRDEQIRKRSEREGNTRRNNERTLMGQYDMNDFTEEVLPQLEWNKLIDMFKYVDQVMGAKGMLDFIESHKEHKLGQQFMDQFNSVVLGGGPVSVPAETSSEQNIPAGN